VLVGFFTKLNCNVIHGVTAAKLHIAVDDIEYFMSRTREETAKIQSSENPMDHEHSVTGNVMVDIIAEQVVTQVQDDFANFNRCGGAPMLVYQIFAQWCTLIALMRYSLFISCSLSALLFTCDMVTASALGALFFQASGGALAENVDPRCEPANIHERLGQLLAVGSLSVIVGLVPSLVLSKLHQRDFVSCSPDEFERQLRLWQTQDRMIYTVGLSLLAFCFFFDLLFIANVTPEDGMAWCIACLTSMAQTLLAVPLVMTILILGVVAVSRLSGQVCREVQLLCCNEGFQMEQSMFHRPPQSRWTPASSRRDLRRSRGKGEEHSLEGAPGIFDSPYASGADPQPVALGMPHDRSHWACCSSQLTTELSEEAFGSHSQGGGCCAKMCPQPYLRGAEQAVAV